MPFFQSTNQKVVIAVRDSVCLIILIIQFFRLGTWASATTIFILGQFIFVDTTSASWVPWSLRKEFAISVRWNYICEHDAGDIAAGERLLICIDQVSSLLHKLKSGCLTLEDLIHADRAILKHQNEAR